MAFHRESEVAFVSDHEASVARGSTISNTELRGICAKRRPLEFVVLHDPLKVVKFSQLRKSSKNSQKAACFRHWPLAVQGLICHTDLSKLYLLSVWSSFSAVEEEPAGTEKQVVSRWSGF